MKFNARGNSKMNFLIISLLINISLTFTQETHFIGGYTISTVDGDDIKNLENIDGFKVGIESTKQNDYVTGISYTQRGFVGDVFGKESEFKLNFLTAYVYKPVYKFSPQLDLVVGGELEVFSNGDIFDENINLEDWFDMEGHLLNYGLLLGGRFYINEKMSLVATYYWALDKFWADLDLSGRSLQIYLKF